jgi:hypothetical protein
MSATFMHLNVHLEGGATVAVVSDQRDQRTFEMKRGVGFTNALESMPISLFRYLAFFALKRTGDLPADAKFTEWDNTVIEVEPVMEDGEESNPLSPDVPGSQETPVED